MINLVIPLGAEIIGNRNRYPAFVYLSSSLAERIVFSRTSHQSKIDRVSDKNHAQAHPAHNLWFFSKEERLIPVSKITDLRVTKGCVAGIMGYGNLYIETAGTSGTEIAILDVDNPDYARDLILHLIDQSG